MRKWLRRHDFTEARGRFRAILATGNEEVVMESTFANWRSAVLCLALTAAVVGAGLALALS